MTLRIYDDTTHQAVPREPLAWMIKDDRRNLRFFLTEEAALNSGGYEFGVTPVLLTREEMARAIARADYGYDVEPAKWRYEAADAILARIQERMKP